MELRTFLPIASIWCTDAMVQEVCTNGRVFKSAVCTIFSVSAFEFEVVFADFCRYRGRVMGIVGLFGNVSIIADSNGLFCDSSRCLW